MARPLKLTQEVHDLLVNALRVGITKKSACKYAGIDESTLYKWLELGAQEEQPYFELFKCLRKAEGEAIVRSMAVIETAARSGTWQAAAWRLERLYPDEYGRQVIEQKVSGQVVHAHAWIERLQQGLDAKRHKLVAEPSQHAQSGDIVDVKAEHIE